MTLILASGSRYRQQQLTQLGLEFMAISPDVDERVLCGESPEQLAIRLARSKANAIKTKHPEALVIGSDQVCACDGEIFGKPHTVERACQMLLGFSNKKVTFYTAMCVATADNQWLEYLDQTRVDFRQLTHAEVERYVVADQPLDCAGGFKVECKGLTLFKAVHTTDPSALMGLPLIQLCEWLRQAGLNIP